MTTKPMQAATRILGVSFVVLGFGLLSLWLSYGPFSSEPWFWSFDAHYASAPQGERILQGWGFRREALRLFGTTLLFAFTHGIYLRRHSGFWSASSSPLTWCYGDETGTCSARTKTFALSALLIALIYHILIGPFLLRHSFTQDPGFLTSGYPSAFSPRVYLLPYLLYMPYSLVQFCLVAISTWTLVLRSAVRDRRALDTLYVVEPIEKEIRAYGAHTRPDLHRDAEAQDRERGLLDARLSTWIDLRIDARRRRSDALHDRSLGYAFVGVFVFFLLVWECLFGLIDTLACTAQILTRLTGWLFVVLGMFYFAVRVSRRTKQNNEILKAELRAALAEAHGSTFKGSAELANKTLDTLDDSFLVRVRPYWDITKSPTVFVPFLIYLLLTIGSYWTHHQPGDKWQGTLNRLLPPGLDYAAIAVMHTLDLESGEDTFEWCLGEKIQLESVREYFRNRGGQVLVEQSDGSVANP